MRLSPAFALAAALASCGFELVGGRCEAGYVEERGACIGTSGDGANTGASSSTSGGSPSGGAGAAGSGGEAANGGSGGAPNGGSGGGGEGGLGGSGGGISCDPLTFCAGACVDTMTEPLHCGSCNHACETGLCADGHCQGAFAGHAVVFGVDFGAVAPSSSAAKLLGNAVFLHPQEPLVLSVFEPVGADLSMNAAAQILQLEAASRGRTLSVSIVSSSDELAMQASSLGPGVILFGSLAAADLAAVHSMATSLAQPLLDFASQGGIVIGLAREPKLAAFLSHAELFGELTMSTSQGPLAVASWVDALSSGVLSPFAHPTPKAFASPELGASVSSVVEASDGEPVVIHRVFSP